jgi:hypothetical protein
VEASEQAGKDDDDDDFLPLPSSSKSKPPAAPPKPPSKPSTLDQTAEDLIPRLTPQNVADLVLLSMVSEQREERANREIGGSPIIRGTISKGRANMF